MPASDLNGDGVISQYEQDLFNWQQRKNSGDPFPGPTPQPSQDEFLSAKMHEFRAMPGIPNYDLYRQQAQAGAQSPYRQNPYNVNAANQARAAQAALTQQMLARATNPAQSVAGLQGTMALGQNASQALGAMGAGPLGSRMAAARATGIGGGLAGGVGQAQSQEMLGGLGSGFGASSALRGGDLSIAGDRAQAGLRQLALDNAQRQFFAMQGSALDRARQQQALEFFKVQEQLRQAQNQGSLNLTKQGAGMAAGVFGGFLR